MKHNAKGIANALKVAAVPKSISPEKAMTLVLRLARGHGRGIRSAGWFLTAASW